VAQRRGTNKLVALTKLWARVSDESGCGARLRVQGILMIDQEKYEKGDRVKIWWEGGASVEGCVTSVNNSELRIQVRLLSCLCCALVVCSPCLCSVACRGSAPWCPGSGKTNMRSM